MLIVLAMIVFISSILEFKSPKGSLIKGNIIIKEKLILECIQCVQILKN